MAWYHGTFSCGHEGRVNIIGPTKDRQWKADRKFEGMCGECYEKFLEEQREKANTEAAEKAKQMELPELTGTEKQVAWANTLRQKFIDNTNKFIQEEKEDWKFWTKKYPPLKKAGLEDIALILAYILENKTDAKYYIDNRDERVIGLISNEIDNAIKTDEEIIQEKTELEVKVESTVKPANAITDMAAEITVNEDKMTVKFEKNDKFREIVKELSFRWEDGAWRRSLNSLTGSSADRAAELGNKLLNAGFPIIIMDETVRNNAVNGIYEAECNRWITLRSKGEYTGRLAIRWWEDNDRLYKTARKIPGSKWDSKCVVIKIEHYKEVEEFAEMYDFKFNTEALEAIKEYKLALEKVKIVNPTEVIVEKPKDGLQEILNSSTDILDDLRED